MVKTKQVGEEWDDSKKSKDQIKARLLDRKEAAKRRERARAYAFSHQVANYLSKAFYF